MLRKEVQHPPRGEVYDRNGELLVRSIASYDLMAIPRDVGEFDTLALARIAGVTPEKPEIRARQGRPILASPPLGHRQTDEP